MGQSTTTLDYPGLGGEEVQCFSVKSVFFLLTLQKDSSLNQIARSKNKITLIQGMISYGHSPSFP